MLGRSQARIVAALLTFVSTAAAQAQLEWDHEPQTTHPYRLSVGAVMPDSSGGWYLTATKNQLSVGAGAWLPLDELLLRYDAAGALTGTHSLGAQSGGSPFLVDATGGFWTVLYSAGNTSLRRFDAAGIQQHSIPISYTISPLTAVGLAPNGDIFAGGAHSGVPAIAGASGWMATGVQEWALGLFNPNYTNGSVGAASTTGLIALALTGPPNAGRIHVVSSNGSLVWSVTTPASLRVSTLCFTPTDELVAVGEDGSGAGTILKWDPSGPLEWTYTCPLVSSSFKAVAIAPDGRIAAVGAGPTSPTGTDTALVASTAGDGTQPWTASWTLSTTSSRHRFDRVLFDAARRVVVGGSASLNSPSLQGQLQSVPVIASFSPGGSLAWQFVGTSLHNEEICTGLNETATGSFVYSSTATDLSGTVPAPDGGRMLSVRPHLIVFCSGDGTATACPCGNVGAVGHGCASSVNAAGARLYGQGIPSITADSLLLQGSDMSNSAALYFQGTAQTNGGVGAVFGDGLRCASGTVIRLGAKTNTNGASQFPDAGDQNIAMRGGVTSAGTRTYQVWYRNAAAFCTPSTFNLSNGVQISWLP